MQMTTVPLPQLERYFPLPQAAKRIGISQAALRRLVESGQVKAVALPDGEIGVSENGIHAAQLDQFIPLSKAAHRFGIGQNILRQLIESGKIRAATVPDGEIVVSETSAQVAIINEQLKSVRREEFRHLRGHPITIAEAIEKYDIPGMTVRG